MRPDDIRKVLEAVSRQTISVDAALARLKSLPFEDIGFASLDHHRTLRKGFPEVIWGEGKTAPQIITIIKNMLRRKHPILVTRVDAAKAARIKRALPALTYHPASRLLTLQQVKSVKQGRGTILVVSAGTSDIPVAEEALLTASIMGNEVDHLYDVGVAGIHRLMDKKDKLFSAAVLIVVAGMEGALPSVIGGLVEKPVIAVPTSTGYGTGFGGIAALLSMLNSCASGIAVVNIDNGFGAGYIASLINRASVHV
jgi:NCAIR mutase (PurE)-related protein